VAPVIHLDTHAVVWLYAGDLPRFPTGARRRLEHEELRISPIVALELDYLHEVGRIGEGASAVLQDLARTLGLVQDDGDFGDVVSAARALTWTRDPFDRLIVGNALVAGANLMTKDRTILRHCRQAVWG
jgi:PIN domain nuclease of toxin-antitoxin system